MAIAPVELGTEWVPADDFAARLALIRQALGGWNVKRTADLCGIDDQSWRNWEAGRGKPRDYEEVCRRIARATDCDLRWLLAGGPLRSRCFYVVPVKGQQELPFPIERQLCSV